MPEIKTHAILKHINLRKEGPEDAKEPAFDLKLLAIVPAMLIDELMCGSSNEKQALEGFWLPDGSPRFLQIETVRFERQIDHCVANISDIEMKDCKAKNFSFIAKDKHTAELGFSVSSKQWPSNALAILAELLQESVSVHLWCPQGDLFAENSQEQEAA